MRDDATGRTLTAHESRETPWLSVVLGFGPMLPLVAGAAAAWWMRGQPLDYLVALVTILYGAAILLFLAGVRRGVSFRTEGGPTVVQIATMFGLFALGLSALVTVVMGKAIPALALLIVGYAAIAVLDPIAARTGEAPLFFARLRPLQMPIAVVSLAALLWLKWISPY
ncbi:hypothetical protein AFCDBAGC_3636 [Methylobacterium cerastii]|uniref:DUF3429 domain-containing protein n=1 Tax=Methylobacterium cerastii TaxID=932741 RepID=A0ABQ4QL28_9HYPH|nr:MULTISPECIES: DUF3429 domain-containing protein [Methylobacterium]TXN01338.1 DUF3429 domain-containing protein [Methylobacterium sp. WL122]TXM74632.1 DUF3429 domain-containing protein [Methylobacterium sp. WL12]TXM95625.1 DUF3429 domain-containing protein [Methylobacterium sp. WL103]TXN81213.1 DUF3429 domain-containing protein [Methylobacterium sp. WL8]GJD45759.1 hypothetical protein AFCDBAGC_3636 [Methylobacterium cerastii]